MSFRLEGVHLDATLDVDMAGGDGHGTDRRGDKLTVLTVTLKGVAAGDAGSIVGVLLSEEPPGMLRRRPVLSGGDSAETERILFKNAPRILRRTI